MKVLHVINSLSVGGAEMALHNILLNGLNKHSENYVISLSNDGLLASRIRNYGIEVTSLNIQDYRSAIHIFSKIRRIFESFQPDIIQGWMYHANIAAFIISFLAPGHPVVVWNIRQCLHDINNEKYFTRWIIRLGRLLSARPASIIYNSKLSQSLHEKYGFCQNKSKLLPNGFDLTRFSPSKENRDKIRNEINVPHDAIVIGHFARFHKMKDHANFLKAASNITNENDSIHFLMCGLDITENNVLLKPLISEFPNKYRLHLLGERHDIHKLMASIDIYCLSSWSEAFPNVIGEAMASGVPCVSTDVGDSSMIIGKTGILVPARDAYALAEGLNRLITLSVMERSALGQAARHRISEYYSIESIVLQYFSLYKSLSTDSNT